MNGASIIIPALNEEKNIAIVIGSIRKELAKLNMPYEIIVVDHGSIDNTRQIAESLDVCVVNGASLKTIAALRNKGACLSKYEILVFLDADVQLSDSWHQEFEKITADINTKPDFISGSHVIPPESNSSSLLHHYWYKSFAEDTRNTHIGSAHMIIRKDVFNTLDGFDELLETGEDYDFCVRARNRGIQIDNNLKLQVFHHDFPYSIVNFIKRESWHGKNDFTSIKNIIHSRVALATLIFIVINIYIICGLVRLDTFHIIYSLSFMITLLILSSWYKYRHANLLTIFINSYLFFYYYIGRSWSLVRVLYDKYLSR